MEATHVADAITSLEKANAGLDVDLVPADTVRDLLAAYARAEKLAAYGRTALARKLDATEVARATGTSVGKAKATVETAKALCESDNVSDAFRAGDISLDQASEIAKAEEAVPGVASQLLEVADKESFSVLREKARKAKLEAEQQRGLGDRQHDSRSARSYLDDLGMVNVHLCLEPHGATPIVTRAAAAAGRLYRKAKRDGRTEPFERHLADAYASLLSGAGSGRARRPELVVLVSYEVAKRGWKDVRPEEVCKIPGVGPVSPEVARDIAENAFLNAVLYDGKDLRHFKRWTRTPSVEVVIALELGAPPDFDGVRCVDCGNRFHPEGDHVVPHVAHGPASTTNLKWRCWPCHHEKTARDRRAGKLRAPDP
jgi:5-methylcytosine-specific restriction endonuclease McrA